MSYAQSNGMQQAKAFAWEFWANGWRGQLLGLVGIVGFASLVYGVISLESDLVFRGTDVGTSMHFGFYWVTLVFLGAPILLAWGAPHRRYTLPTSSLAVVACPLVLSMASMFVLYATAATTLNWLYDAGWPIWGPGLLAAFLVGWLQAMLWATSNSLGLQLVSGSASFGVLLFTLVIFALPGEPVSGWFGEGIDASHALMFGVAALVCVGVGTVGFANLRHGGGIDVNRILDWVSRLLPRAARSTPFASPASAQFWLEWTERSRVMPIGTALVGVVMLLIAPFVAPADSDESINAVEFINACSVFLLMPVFVVGLFLGSRSANGQFGNFNGSRPLADSQIANAVLLSATVGLLASAFVWAAVVGTALLILGRPVELLSLEVATEQFRAIGPLGVVFDGIRLLALATLVLGAIWGTVGVITSLVLAGRQLISVVIGTLLCVWIAGTIGPRFLLSEEAQAGFQRVFLWAFVVIPFVGVAAAFFASWRLKLISHSTLVLAAAIVAVMFTAAQLVGLPDERGIWLPVLWACCLTPAALAAAPLAVWWNRHR